MSYYVLISMPGGTLLQVSSEPILTTEGTMLKAVPGDMPDLGIFEWSPQALCFVKKPENRILTKRQFLSRITPEEYAAIKGASLASPMVDYFWQMFTLSEDIDLDFPDTFHGIHMLEQAGVLGAGRAAEILA